MAIVIAVLIVVALCMAIAFMHSATQVNKNKLKENESQNPNPGKGTAPVFDEAFEEKWRALSRYDDAVRAPIEKVKGLGPGAVNELKRAFYALEDKQALDEVADRIIQDVESGALDLDEMETEESGVWYENGRRFERDGDLVIETYGGQTFYWKNDKRFLSREQALQSK